MHRRATRKARLAAGRPDLEPIAGATPEVVWTSARLGRAAARNAGLRRATGSIVVLVDTSTEPTGDALTPLEMALSRTGRCRRRRLRARLRGLPALQRRGGPIRGRDRDLVARIPPRRLLCPGPARREARARREPGRLVEPRPPGRRRPGRAGARGMPPRPAAGRVTSRGSREGWPPSNGSASRSAASTACSNGSAIAAISSPGHPVPPAGRRRVTPGGHPDPPRARTHPSGAVGRTRGRGHPRRRPPAPSAPSLLGGRLVPPVGILGRAGRPRPPRVGRPGPRRLAAGDDGAARD